VRWEIVILLIMLAYPLAQTAEVHGEIVSNEAWVPVPGTGGITFAISADNNTLEGRTLDVNLSVTGAWNNFYGYLYCDDQLFNGVIIPPYVDHYVWSSTYSISGLGAGWHSFKFEAYYYPEGGPTYQGPVMVSVLAYVLPSPTPPPTPPKPTLNLTWLTPLSKHNSFEAGRTIPIRFSIHNNTDFKPDQSVNVTVTGPGGYVFSATYGTHRDDVRIRESAEYYIVYWKTPRTTGSYTISVEFQGFYVDSPSLSISLR